MSDVSRRDAIKLAATGAALTVGAAAAAAQDRPAGDTPAGKERWTGRKTADAKTLEKKTEPIAPKLGVKPFNKDAREAVETDVRKARAEDWAPMGVQPRSAFWAEPDPRNDGLRVKAPNQPEIYLIMDGGYRRWVPDPATYNNLFRSWEGIVIDLDIHNIPLGPNISSGAILAQAYGQPAIYLIDQGTKRHILSPAVMDKYHFAWEQVNVVSPAFLDSIEPGPSIG